MQRSLQFVRDARKPAAYTLHVFNQKTIEKQKKTITLPEKFCDELIFEKKSTPFKFASFPEGYGRTSAFLILTDELSTFTLHETLRKSLPMDTLLKGSALINVATISAFESERVLNAVGNLFALASYSPERFGRGAVERSERMKKQNGKSIEIEIRSSGKAADAEKIFETGYREGSAINLVRKLSDLPGNELRPEHYLDRVKTLMKDHKITSTFYDQKALKKLNAGAFLAVVRANPSEPYGILKLHYKPNKKPKVSKKKVAIVGKGLCYDTGGYNIKVGESMFGMHRDMTGSAVALALTKHLIEEESEVEIETYLALAENLISPSAYRPNDVVTASNGVSIEVVDTDAEGRMVLADTLVMASNEKPDLIIDFATLTGAILRSIGTARSGIFSNSEKLLAVGLKAGNETGERVWSFPIGEDYMTGLESEVADIKQCGPGNFCDHIYAATFLSQFVENNVPWIHVDLSAESNKGGLGLSGRDVTGFGVRFGKRVIQSFLKRS